MKKVFFVFIAIFSMAMKAQNITDAVRYSTTELNGTARYRAMSGAFGALGGDLSAINFNPAGSAVFLNGQAAFTLNIENTDTDVAFKNGITNTSDNRVDLGQAGAVFVFNNQDEDAVWKKLSLAVNYNKTATFEDDWLARGDNSNTINSYFLGYANGLPLDFLVPANNETVDQRYSYLGERVGFGAQQAYLGYEAYLFDAVDPTDLDNNEYISNVAPGIFDQEYAYTGTGLNGKFSFNFAAQYQDFLYLGLNLNSHFIDYEQVTSISELNNNEGSSINEIYFEDRLNTLGSGFSFQLGAIAKVGSNVRAGLAYESPTWYSISEETTQYLESFSDADGLSIVKPNVVNIYPDYKIQTPSVYTGSLAYLFGDQALISFDYSYKDYSATKFKPKDDPDFAFQNDLMQRDLKGASIFRVGGEYRLMNWSFRGGYRFEESPYSDETTIGELNGYSVGLGYNFGNIKLDVAYDAFEQDSAPRLYQAGLTDRAYLNRNNSNVTLSLSFGI